MAQMRPACSGCTFQGRAQRWEAHCSDESGQTLAGLPHSTRWPKEDLLSKQFHECFVGLFCNSETVNVFFINRRTLCAECLDVNNEIRL